MLRLGPAEIVIILGLMAFVLVVVVVLYWVVRWATRPGGGQEGADKQRGQGTEVDLAELAREGITGIDLPPDLHKLKLDSEMRAMKREADLDELDQHGRLLYQLIERVDALFQVQQEQAHELSKIGRWVTLFGILWLLGLAVGCFLVLAGEVSLFP